MVLNSGGIQGLERGTVAIVATDSAEDSLTWYLVECFGSTIWNVLPIAAVVIVFQVLVLRRPLQNLPSLSWGFLFVVLGLTFFLVGLEVALFPLGQAMARQLTSPEFLGDQVDFGGREIPAQVVWYRFYWTYLFAFLIGFSTTVAEPSLIAVAMKAEEVSGGAVRARGLRFAVALGVAVGITLGAFRIVMGHPLALYIILGYVFVMIQTYWAPRSIVPLAYDSGGVTTSTVTVPLVTALGLGLASQIPGRNPLVDGFGLIAFASLFPIISVLGYAQLEHWLQQRWAKKPTQPNTKSPPLAAGGYSTRVAATDPNTLNHGLTAISTRIESNQASTNLEDGPHFPREPQGKTCNQFGSKRANLQTRRPCDLN